MTGASVICINLPAHVQNIVQQRALKTGSQPDVAHISCVTALMWTAEAPSFVTPDPEVLGTAGNTCFIRIKGCLCCLLINYFFFSRFFLLFTPRICSHSTLFCKENDQERDIQANDDDDSEKYSLGCSGCLTEHFTIPLVDHKHKTSCRNTF